MSLPKYPEYEDSGVEWLGKTPTHWEVCSIKQNYAVIGGATPKSDVNSYWDGDIEWITPADLSRLQGFEITESIRRITEAGLHSCGTSMVPAGSIILSTRAPIGSLGIASVPLCTNQGCKALVPKPDQVSRFVAYALTAATAELNIRGKGTTFLELSGDELRRFQLSFPGDDEQFAIATFLDHETSKIDALISEQEKLLVLLAEKRQATISHAVTRGLEPNALTKDSGIPWLGEVPAHWDVVPLMRMTDPSRPIMYGIVLPGPDVGEGVPILKGGNVKPARMNLESMARTTPEIEAPYARARLKPGDLVYAIRGTIGDCEVVPVEMDGSNITQDVARVAVADTEHAGWVRWALLSTPIREELAVGSLGAAVRGVNIFDLKRVKVPKPPVAEQRVISRYLEERIGEIDHLSMESTNAIALLKERRSALISAAVTGKIDVRGLVVASV